MNPDGITYLQTATNCYNLGDLVMAEQNAVQALCLLASDPDPMRYLECLTLLQSIYSRTENLSSYQSLEPQLKKYTFALDKTQGIYYYALHLLDTADLLIRTHRLTQAQDLLDSAFETFLELEDSELPVNFLYTYYKAASCYAAENYTACIHFLQQACAFWTQLEGSGLVSSNEFVQRLSNFLLQPLNYMFPVHIYLANAYNKIGDTDAAIRLLSPLLNDSELDYYRQALVNLTLAECYARRNEFEESDRLMAPYRNIPYQNYPALAGCIDSIEFCKQMNSGKVVIQVPLTNALTEQAQWFSPDLLIVRRYNYALALAGSQHFEECLSVLHQVGQKGLALKLAVLHQMGREEEIPALFQQAARCYVEEIQNILMYYEENNAYHSITMLSIQTQLVLGASFQTVSPRDLYHFLLNCKGITYDADYLLKHSEVDDSAQLLNRIVAPEEIQKLLSPDELLLEYTIVRTLEDEYYAFFAVTASSIHCTLLGTASELNDLIQQFCINLTDSMEDLASARMKELATSLRRKLILPIREEFNAKEHLLIVPAGKLFELPFELLTIRSSQYLYEKYQIRCFQLGRELIYRLHEDTAASETPNAVAFGNPAYIHSPMLPYSQSEITTIHQLYPGSVFSGEEATRENFLSSCTNADILHLAVHGVYDADAPGNHLSALSCYGLIFADDEFLCADDILGLDLKRVNLCVLSACSSGLGKVHSTEGIYGLRRAFTLAGCHDLIVSLWNVEDASASLLMSTFYRALRDGCNQLDALNKAKETLRTRTLGEWNTLIQELGEQDLSLLFPHQSDSYIPYQHPYYWAGYILT